MRMIIYCPNCEEYQDINHNDINTDHGEMKITCPFCSKVNLYALVIQFRAVTTSEYIHVYAPRKQG